MSVSYFSGFDAAGDDELWQTDGTAAGTVELTPDAGFIDGFSDLGLYPHSIVVNNGVVYFAGRDPTTNTDAIYTYSAAKGLAELTVPGSTTDFSGPGFVADNLIVFNGLVYFSGVNSAGKDVLWKTDGTSAGTSQVGAGVAFTNPDYLTVLGGNLYFAADEQVGPSPSHHLWKLDGTTGAVTAANTLETASLTALGSKLLFEATNFGSNQTRGEVAIYDPATGQSTQLTQPSSPDPLSDTNTFRGELAVFAVIGNLAYFRTADNLLDVTDGTVAGTHPITGFTGITGGFYELGAVIGKVLMLLFVDANNVAGLWVTNGTGAGTHEVVVNGAAAGGVQPLDITQLNATQWIFNGVDAAGHNGLWDSDGTTAGTHEIGPAGAATGGLNPEGFTPFPASGSQGLTYTYAADGTTLTELDSGGNGTTGARFDVYAANIIVGLAANSHLTLTGANDTVNVGASSTLSAIGGGYRIHVSTNDALTVSGTAGAWDSVYATNGALTVSGAQASVVGGGDTVTFSGAGNTASLYNTTSWDVVQGSAGITYLNGARASFITGGQVVAFNAAASVASLYHTTAWDVVQGLAGTTYLNGAQASFVSGGQAVVFNGAGGYASLYNTTAWDLVSGLAGTTILNGAQASFVSGGQTVVFNGAGSYASLYNTTAWDVVQGGAGATILNGAQASFVTGGQTVIFNGAGSYASLYNTTTADTIQGGAGTTLLNGARASFLTSGQTVYFNGGTSAATLVGGNDTFDLLGAFGHATINGFSSSDVLLFSAADKGALKTTVSGGNTYLTLDANDVLTLTGASVTAPQIKYV